MHISRYSDTYNWLINPRNGQNFAYILLCATLQQELFEQDRA